MGDVDEAVLCRVRSDVCLLAASSRQLRHGTAAAQTEHSRPRLLLPPPPPPNQVALTAKQIEGFIAAQKDITAVTKKIPASSTKPDPKIGAQLDGAAKKYGFKELRRI